MTRIGDRKKRSEKGNQRLISAAAAQQQQWSRWIKIEIEASPPPQMSTNEPLNQNKKWSSKRSPKNPAQKSASSTNFCSVASDMTPLFWYSPTRFSKKLVFPSRLICSMKSKGFLTL